MNTKKTISAEEQRHKMLTDPVAGLVTALAIPGVLVQMISVIYNTADTWFVSQISTSASAAVGVVFSLQSLLQAFTYSISMGCQSLMSRHLGADENREAETVAASSVVEALVITLLIAVPGLLFTRPLVRLLGATETMLPYAAAYARIILCGAPVLGCSFVLSGALRAQGMAKRSAIAMSAGGLLNIVLDPLFIFTLNMGTAGAALATVLSQSVSLIILLVLFLAGLSPVKLTLKSASRKWGLYWSIFTTGMPTMFRQGMASLSSALLNRAGAPYGDAAVAAITISNKVYLLVRNIVMGVGQGFQPVAGYNFGAGDKKRTRASFQFAVLVGTVICCLGGVITAVFPGEIIAWFRNDPEVIEVGKEMLYYVAAAMPFMAFSTYVNQLYQCLGFKLPATFLASCRQGVCFVPLILLLPALLHRTGVCLTQPAADILTFVICVPFQIVFFRRHLSVSKEA